MSNLIRKNTHYDAIEKYLITGGTEELTDFQNALLKRWTFIHDQVLARKGEKEVVNMLHLRFGVSVPTAYRDLNHSKKLFGKANPLDRDYCLKVAWESTLQAINEARLQGDYRAVAALNKNMITIAINLSPVDEDIRKIFNQFNIQIVANPAEVGLPVITEEEAEKMYHEFSRKRLQ